MGDNNQNYNPQLIHQTFQAEPPSNIWKSLLFSLLPYKPHPLLVVGDSIFSAAALWSYTKLWKDFFRELGLGKGHTLLLTLEPSIEWVIVVLASLWENMTVVLSKSKATHVLFKHPTLVISEDHSISNITFDQQKYPILLKSPSFSDYRSFPFLSKSGQNKTEMRIIFEDGAGFSDDFLIQGLIEQYDVSKTWSTKSSIHGSDWRGQTAFYKDFFLPFFCEHEMFVVRSLLNDPISIQKIFLQYEIDWVYGNHELCELFSRLIPENQKNKIQKCIFEL